MSTVSSINKVISKLTKIQNSASRIDYWFFRYSLNWIKNRANTLLDQRTNGYNSSIARQWNIHYYNTSAILENQDPNSGAIEFGIGMTGLLEHKHPKAKNYNKGVAYENGYKFDVDSPYKDNNRNWSFQLPDGRWITTSGYVGKSFLFDAFMEYKQKKKYVELYQKAFDKVMKGIGKKV